ncbi:L,D-transpeptidase family protein [Streptomyces mexicanus]
MARAQRQARLEHPSSGGRRAHPRRGVHPFRRRRTPRRPGRQAPYTQDEEAFETPYYWDENHWHDFDYVIAINYNRVPGTRPDDPTRPLGQKKGGGIWLHLDHGDGTLGCVSVPGSAMRYLLRTLDPESRPVVVMGDKTNLRA